MNHFADIIAELKLKSPYYPKVLFKSNVEMEFITELYASTLVRIEREGVSYVVHCVESIVLTRRVTERELLLKLMDSAYKIIVLYPITGKYEDVDTLQIPEKERIAFNNK